MKKEKGSLKGFLENGRAGFVKEKREESSHKILFLDMDWYFFITNSSATED